MNMIVLVMSQTIIDDDDNIPQLLEHNKTSNIPIEMFRPSTQSNYMSKSWTSRLCKFNKFNSQTYISQLKSTDSSPISSEYEILLDKYNFDSRLNKLNKYINLEFKPYNAIVNCKSAGIIPYTIYDNNIYFLFQKTENPIRKKDYGWNDFGGKRSTIESTDISVNTCNNKTTIDVFNNENIKNNYLESTAETAAREFSEETSCLFYLKEKNDDESNKMYDLLKENDNLSYDIDTIKILKKLISISQKFYTDKITEYVLPIYVSSKETYISYFVKVNYIPEKDLPRAEDIHILYDDRYIRKCKWFSINEILILQEKDFHKRLQITKIQQRIYNYYNKGLFIY